MNKSAPPIAKLAGTDRRPTLPPGQRVYAVGDIHGRRDLFEAMIRLIEQDDADSGPAQTTVILLGDLVDRGPDSADVLARARKWKEERDVRILGGNHEEMFLESFRKKDVLRHFLRFGGKETLISYGIMPSAKSKSQIEALQALMASSIPEGDLEFIRGFEEMIEIGDYLFVHAGIAPDKPVKKQKPSDVRWIREPFLSHKKPLSHFVVHGHTIYPRAEVCSNRIGLDTGAFNTGRLTGLVLEGTGRRLLEVKEKKGVITARERKVDE